MCRQCVLAGMVASWITAPLAANPMITVLDSQADAFVEASSDSDTHSFSGSDSFAGPMPPAGWGEVDATGPYSHTVGRFEWFSVYASSIAWYGPGPDWIYFTASVQVLVTTRFRTTGTVSATRHGNFADFFLFDETVGADVDLFPGVPTDLAAGHVYTFDAYCGHSFDAAGVDDRQNWAAMWHNATVVPIPEPASVTMGILGLGLVGWLRRRAAHS